MDFLTILINYCYRIETKRNVNILEPIIDIKIFDDITPLVSMKKHDMKYYNLLQKLMDMDKLGK